MPKPKQVHDAEPAAESSHERALLQALVSASVAVDEAKRVLEKAEETKQAAEAAMTEYLIQNDKDRTARYTDLGFASLQEPTVIPTVTDQAAFYAWLRSPDIDRGDIIKEAIHVSTLKSFVKNFIQENGNAALPSSVSVFMKPKARAYPPKKGV